MTLDPKFGRRMEQGGSRVSEGRAIAFHDELVRRADAAGWTVRLASDIAIAAGADFIKTSTGKTPRSASLDATEIMLDVIHGAGRPVGLKPSGGIRTLADAAAYLAQADSIMGSEWATPATFRFGASGLLTALVATIEGEGGGAAAAGQGVY